MGEEGVFAFIIAERELEDAHAGQVEIVAEFFDGGRDQAEVFGNERQPADAPADGGEQFAAGGFHPSPAFGRAA